MFEWKWWLKDIKQDKDVSVFSLFSCGGGSSMGYKRAGFRVLGNVEIDPRMNEIYCKNLKPKWNFCMDARDFNKQENLPDELFHLDILDGSPPCTTFSMAGQREKTWGKEKRFAEGQKLQTLDDLFFVWLDTVERLKPKIAIAENVAGLIRGNAKGYVNAIIKRFHEIGYDVQIFLLNAAFMDVPQSRERVFFIANNQGYPKLKLDFHGEPIPFGKVRTEHGKPLIKGEQTKKLLEKLRSTDKDLRDVLRREEGRESRFNAKVTHDKMTAQAITASGEAYRACDKSRYSDDDFRNVGSFPQDYDFMGRQVQYMIGMSVPPNMMANIAAQIWEQWLK